MGVENSYLKSPFCAEKYLTSSPASKFPAPGITPFKNGELDKSSFKKIIKWHIGQGTKGIIPCGTTGESPTLSHEEHKEVVELAETDVTLTRNFYDISKKLN